MSIYIIFLDSTCIFLCGIAIGRIDHPPLPSQSRHRHHDIRVVGSVPARPTAGTENPSEGSAVSVGGIDLKGGGDLLGGAQASTELSGTPPPVADCYNVGRLA